ncbi:hypothetical protein JOB18_047774 [Solea senegalensis]|uniref:Uncharacterized protein n=1 Tax=Solea senegalensis TaxID=28829 RepID=A0AAV6RW33_SOLSE|nr:hypothetical protein JOB18_047774 [Solea senegalensis]
MTETHSGNLPYLMPPCSDSLHSTPLPCRILTFMRFPDSRRVFPKATAVCSQCQDKSRNSFYSCSGRQKVRLKHQLGLAYEQESLKTGRGIEENKQRLRNPGRLNNNINSDTGITTAANNKVSSNSRS